MTAGTGRKAKIGRQKSAGIRDIIDPGMDGRARNKPGSTRGPHDA